MNLVRRCAVEDPFGASEADTGATGAVGADAFFKRTGEGS